MIPLVASVRWRRPGGRAYGLWLPLFVLWLILLPVVLVLLPVVILILALARARPLATLAALWNLFLAISGTEIDVDGPDGAFAIRIV
jgi:hypothetical protein